ncbi:hypothetical protein ACLOJK_019036 [Asimina triloba]
MTAGRHCSNDGMINASVSRRRGAAGYVPRYCRRGSRQKRAVAEKADVVGDEAGELGSARGTSGGSERQRGCWIQGRADVTDVMGDPNRHERQPAVAVDEADGLGFGNGAKSAAMGASSSATKETGLSLLAAVSGAALRPHWILDELDVVDMMNDSDWPMGCSPSMGLPERRMSSTAAVMAVALSPSTAGGCWIREGSSTASF